MKKISFLLCMVFIFFTSCIRSDNYPTNHHSHHTHITCVNDKISQFQQDDNLCATGATVKKYVLQSDSVYVFDLGPCGNDFTLDVIDEQCNFLGNLGGFAGFHTINGVNFYDSAIYVQTVWNN